MDYQTVNKQARAFLKSIGVVNPLRATYNAERTWQNGHISYIVLPFKLGEPVNAAEVAKGIADNLRQRPTKPSPVGGPSKGDVTLYRWISKATGNVIGVTDNRKDEGVVLVTLIDPHYRESRAGKIDENAVHEAGKIGYR